MGAYLGFDIEGHFDACPDEKKSFLNSIFKKQLPKSDFDKAQDFFRKIIKYKDRYDKVGAVNWDPNSLLDRLNICYGGKIYEIRKSNPIITLLPEKKQTSILKDIDGLYMKLQYDNPKHYFVYDLSTIMLPDDPERVWLGKELLAEKFCPSVGFSHNISRQNVDRDTRKILGMATKYQLVLSLRV